MIAVAVDLADDDVFGEIRFVMGNEDAVAAAFRQPEVLDADVFAAPDGDAVAPFGPGVPFRVLIIRLVHADDAAGALAAHRHVAAAGQRQHRIAPAVKGIPFGDQFGARGEDQFKAVPVQRQRFRDPRRIGLVDHQFFRSAVQRVLQSGRDIPVRFAPPGEFCLGQFPLLDPGDQIGAGVFAVGKFLFPLRAPGGGIGLNGQVPDLHFTVGQHPQPDRGGPGSELPRRKSGRNAFAPGVEILPRLRRIAADHRVERSRLPMTAHHGPGGIIPVNGPGQRHDPLRRDVLDPGRQCKIGQIALIGFGVECQHLAAVDGEPLVRAFYPQRPVAVLHVAGQFPQFLGRDAPGGGLKHLPILVQHLHHHPEAGISRRPDGPARQHADGVPRFGIDPDRIFGVKPGIGAEPVSALRRDRGRTFPRIHPLGGEAPHFGGAERRPGKDDRNDNSRFHNSELSPFYPRLHGLKENIARKK